MLRRSAGPTAAGPAQHLPAQAHPWACWMPSRHRFLPHFVSMALVGSWADAVEEEDVGPSSPTARSSSRAKPKQESGAGWDEQMEASRGSSKHRLDLNHGFHRTIVRGLTGEDGPPPPPVPAPAGAGVAWAGAVIPSPPRYRTPCRCATNRRDKTMRRIGRRAWLTPMTTRRGGTGRPWTARPPPNSAQAGCCACGGTNAARSDLGPCRGRPTHGVGARETGCALVEPRCR